MANRTDYIAAELGKIVTQSLKNMAANKMKVSAANLKSSLTANEAFIEMIKHAMEGGEKSELLKYVTPLKGFVSDAALKDVEDMVFNPDKGFSETMTALLNTLSEHIIALEKRQHKVSSFIEDVFSKFVGLQAELTTSFSNSIDFVEKDLEIDKKNS